AALAVGADRTSGADPTGSNWTIGIDAVRASGRTAPIPALALRDGLMRALGAAGGRAACQDIDGAGVAIVAAGGAIAIAGLTSFDDAIAAGRRAVLIVCRVATGRAAPVAVLTLGDDGVRAGGRAASRAPGERVDRAGVAVAAVGRAVAVAR